VFGAALLVLAFKLKARQRGQRHASATHTAV
jgi:hypothetical protein